MNIGFFYSNYEYPPTSGSGVHCYQLVKNLTMLGYRIQTCYFGGVNPEVVHFRGRELAKFIRASDIFYIRTDIRYRLELFTLLKVLSGFRKPVVWEINAPPEERYLEGNLGKPPWFLKMRRSLLSFLTDAAVCVSEPILEYTRRELKIKKAYVVPNGSDPIHFSPDKKVCTLYKKPFNVIWAGSTRFSWHGIGTILEAARKLELLIPDLGFVIIGDRSFLPECVPKNVICTGEIAYTEIPPYLSSGDIGVVIYKGLEKIPRGFYFSPEKLYDYMASGLPVIGHNLGQVREVIKDGCNGVLCNGTAEDLIGKILYLKSNEPLRIQMGKHARLTIENFYNWERVAKQTDNIIRELRKERLL